jgi:SpoVK/Ycf46/Vps4 family AAA+-type ATPase
MRTGFACLFSGAPGTGKTETARQLARRTGRDIMEVDISETKSMWFGESERKVKGIFDRYSSLVLRCQKSKNHLTPILLFNEADGVIGKRMELSGNGRSASIDKTLNAMQNIILQEFENLKGILIATTNLVTNLDPAFDRRFLYKIEFGKPTAEARQNIWRSMLPSLCIHDAKALAEGFDFSGGQIENIARKRALDIVLNGNEPDLERLAELCREETLDKHEANRIGFIQ